MKKLLFVLLCVLLLFSCGNKTNEICLSDFFHKVENKEIKRVTFVTNKNYAEVELNNSNKNPPQFTFKVSYETQLQYIMEKINEIEETHPDDYRLMIEFITINY